MVLDATAVVADQIVRDGVTREYRRSGEVSSL
jgi:hypothetical protein